MSVPRDVLGQGPRLEGQGPRLDMTPQEIYAEQDRLLRLARELKPESSDWDDLYSVLTEDERAFMRRQPCAQCGVDIVRTGEYFMLSDELWQAVSPGNVDKLLCVGCIESRLGRRLTSADFPWDIPLNRLCIINFRASERLLDRMIGDLKVAELNELLS